MNNYNNYSGPLIKTINIKEDSPMADIAVYNLEKEIYYAQKTGTEVLKVIHGYGSHGRGGEIKKKVRKFLFRAKKKNKIKLFVCGEEWSDLNEDVQYIQKTYPLFLIDEDVRHINNGITIILV